jgi:colicin import membrane protein
MQALRSPDSMHRASQVSGQLMRYDWLSSGLVHGLLLLALFLGVQWKTKPHDAPPVQVEIFSPPPEAARPIPPPAPVIVREKPVIFPETPLPPKADISIEKKKPEKPEKPLAKPENKVEPKVETKVENKADKKPEPKPAKPLDSKKLDEMTSKKPAEKKLEDEQAEAKLAEKSRDDVLKKLIASASTGSTSSDKSAEKSSAPGSNMDAGYLSRVRNMIRSNTVFQQPENMQGSPRAEFVVNLMPDCSIVSVKLKKSSGLKSWDDAAERAITRIDRLPRPATGNCSSSIEVSHQPKD